MGKLKMLGSPLTTLRSSVAYMPQGQREQDQHRDRSNAWRGWYKTARWAALRLTILRRDGYTCQATGVLLSGRHPAPNSPVVDHKEPHRGDERLFWDPENLWAVSKAYHDSEKQRQERSPR